MTQRLEQIVAVLLAAGKGTRMASATPKMVQLLYRRPLVHYPAEAIRQAGIQRILVVVGHAADEVRSTLGEGFEYVVQEEQKGTGHALMVVRPVLEGFQGDIVVAVGDAPLLTPEVVRRVVEHRRQSGAAAALLTAVFEDNIPPFGRIVRDAEGRVVRIVEERDATAEERRIREVNASLYCFDAERVLPLLDEIDNRNEAGEYYLTDIVEILRRHGHDVRTVVADDPRTALGVNTRADLAEVFAAMRDRIVEAHQARGVTILDPRSTFIDDSVELGRDTVVYPFTVLQDGCSIGSGCVIGPFVKLSNCRIAAGCEIEFVLLRDVVVSQAGSRISSEALSPAELERLVTEARTDM